MKRLLIVLVVVGAMLIALPATAKKPEKPPKPPTDPPPVLVCDFNEDGVLIDSEGQRIELNRVNSGIRCRLSADASKSLTLKISGDATLVSFPYIAVTDRYPNGGNVCFHDYVRGRTTNPPDGDTDFDADFDFGTFETRGALDTYLAPGDDLHDGRCGPREDTDGADTFALTFQVQKISGGTVHLTMTER
jgi:hypothetical protein